MRKGAHCGRGPDAGGRASRRDRRQLLDGFVAARHVADDGPRIGVGFALESDERRANMHDIVRLAEELFDMSGLRRGDLHDRLVGFHRDERLIGPHLVAFLDVPFDDLGFLHAFAEIGKVEDLHVAPYAYSSALRAAATIRATLGRYWGSSRGSGTTTS